MVMLFLNQCQQEFPINVFITHHDKFWSCHLIEIYTYNIVSLFELSQPRIRIAAKKLPKSEPGGRNPQQGTVTVTESTGGQKTGCCGGK